jgi:putative oxidoreductase
MTHYSSPLHAARLLRVGLGTVLIAHSLWLKLVVFTLPGTAAFFASIGLPPVLAYLVFAIEVVGGLALLFGLATQVVSLVLIPVLLGATWAHAGNGWLFTNAGGGWEYPLFLALVAAVLVLLGDGRATAPRSTVGDARLPQGQP